MSKYQRIQVHDQASQQFSHQLAAFISPFLVELDAKLDKRLVRTFFAALQAIIQFRHQRYGLLLSELGAYILSPDRAPAGTKRLSNLLRSPKWSYTLIERYLWRQADQHVADLTAAEGMALVVWDESVLEKGESLALEGLCAVRSSKARRLKRIKPGYFNPPGGRPIFVPGMHWVTLLTLGLQGTPVVAAMRWWTTRGPLASDRRTVERQLLRICQRRWGRRVIHVWDRGFAGAPWLQQAAACQARFILRWQKGFHLLSLAGQRRKAWRLVQGKRSLNHRLIWDTRRQCWRRTGIYFTPVRHPEVDSPLWLVVSRPGKGRSPWYLLTREPILTVADAWRVVLAYARRWQVEMTYRYGKTELAMESPRLWRWENRLKLLLMVTLVYAFLLSLLAANLTSWRTRLLRAWCHRTGKRYRAASIPLYRLRSALSRLWLAFPPPPLQILG